METLANTIRDALEQEIISGVRFPGERLDEPQLTRQFKVSRTPVREALVELATSGLVEMRPHRSAVVAEIGAGKVIQMYEVLAELESLSARLAVRRMYREEPLDLCIPHEEHDGVVAAMLDRDEKLAKQIFRDHTALRADHVADFIAAYNRRFERHSA